MRLQAPNHRRPVAKVGDAGKEKIAGPGKKIASHGQHEEVARSRSIVLRPVQEEPEDRAEEKIYDGAICRDQARVYIARQRDRAHGHAMGSAQPRCHPMAQAFMQNILENTGQRGDSNHRKPIVLSRHHTAEHSVSYSTGKEYLRIVIRVDVKVVYT